MRNLMLLGGLLALGFPACSTLSTPAARIERFPEKYQALPAEHQELAAQGRIVEGMNTDAVFLAWGAPNHVMAGSDQGNPYETWSYTRLRSATYPSLWFDYGYYGYGHYHHVHPYWNTYWYPVPVGRVEFINGLVNSWQGRY